MPISQTSFPTLRRRLTRWYQAHHRNLPWRKTDDPYAIWVSETMLQQTQVSTVIDYYERFLSVFPNVVELAAADEQAVLSLWQGLGYYRRARQMHAAAKKVVDEFGGEFPRRVEEILSLPGIGRYTAGAIASFAFDTRAPILEANTLRLFSRLLLLRESPKETNSQKRLWEFAEAILPSRSGSRLLNQALMELGSLVCTPQQPKCDACPLQQLCLSYAACAQHEIPVVSSKPKVTELTHVALVLKRGNQVLIRQNAVGEWWEGLWDFPRVNLTLVAGGTGPAYELGAESQANFESVRQAMAETHGLDCIPTHYITMIKHSVTRYRISLDCLAGKVGKGFAIKNLSGNWRWVELDRDSDIPLNASAHRLRRQCFPKWYA